MRITLRLLLAPALVSAQLTSLTSEIGGAVSTATGAPASLLSSATGAAASALASILSFPTIDEIEDDLDIDSSTQNGSTSALLIPSYSNYTANGWNVRFYGFVYHLPNVTNDTLSDFQDDLGIVTDSQTDADLLLNRTLQLISLPVSDTNLSIQIQANGTAIGSPFTTEPSDTFGEIDQFQLVDALSSIGNITQTQTIQLFAQNISGPGNGTSILVPQSGISVISDIDDVLRVTKVYVPTEGLANSFARPYVNLNDTPNVFAHWLQTLPGVAFHYDTTTPLELTRTYVEYLFNNYPLGSLEMRPINLSEPSEVLDARKNSLVRLFETFPNRKFVMVGDTSSSTLLSAYPQIAQQFPSQLACIFIRNTSATDSDDVLPYDTSDFKNLPNNTYFFYVQPDDLLNLDIANGQCVNSSIPQNVTFGEQDAAIGLSK